MNDTANPTVKTTGLDRMEWVCCIFMASFFLVSLVYLTIEIFSLRHKDASILIALVVSCVCGLFASVAATVVMFAVVTIALAIAWPPRPKKEVK